MKKVMLITPDYHCGVVESAGRWPNLGFMYIAGELRRAGFDVIYYDAMAKFHTMEEIRRTINSEQPDCVASTAFTATYPAAAEVLALAKEINPETVTVLGGIHATFCHKDVLKENSDAVDYCVIGEGERTMPELLLALKSGEDPSSVAGIAYNNGDSVTVTKVRPFIEDLDSLRPAWDIVTWSDYPLYFIDDSRVAIVSSSRGCIHECAFCSQYKFWQGSYRERDPKLFVDEMQYLVENHGVNVFFISDEYPTRNRERWEKILELLIKRQLGVHILLETCIGDILRDEDILSRYREAGIMFIYAGVEATSQERLDVFRKDIKFEQSRKAIELIKGEGMISESSLIVGLPDETPESIAETLELAMLYDSDYMHFLFITPWPYADMWEDLSPHVEVTDYSKYNLVEPIVKPVNMTRDELFSEILNCYRTYYMRKLPEWLAMKGQDFKRNCLLKGMNAIMEHSFLKEHMGGLGGMPEQVKTMLGKLAQM